MATLSALVDGSALERIEVDLEDELPWRCLFGTPEFVKWLEQILPTLETGIMGADLTPLEQVDALFFEFISGEPLEMDRRFKPLRYNPDLYVWELKTIDVRIFGWFAAMDHFVCCFGEHKDELTRKGNANTLIAQCSFIRQTLDLDEPKYVQFKEYANVLSDKY